MQLIVEKGRGLERANTYITIKDVEKFSETNLGFKKWIGYYDKNMDINIPGLDEDEKIEIIIGAGMILNKLKYIGEKVSDCQGMAFPRNFNDYYFGGSNCSGENVSQCSGIVPHQLKKAQMIIIRDILEGAIDTTGNSYSPKVKTIFFQQGGSITFAGPTKLTQDSTGGFKAVNPDPFHSVRELLSPFLRNSRLGATLVRS